ncbi:MAG TPA: SgcJ/EcaC family oxidoreductase [Flavilitoribacter sp.]|nr:SgcJ/EcaC family oxidoreductase [Flavilitoribacter sp.]HMQ91073.1 SgcJ/EcaC family oxidoreductase [Flavilitoribacter sp.]
MKTITFSFTILFAFVFSNVLTAQSDLSPDEMAVRQIMQDLQDAWNNKSGEQFAAHFAADHSIVVWSGLYMPHLTPEVNAESHQGLFDSVFRTLYMNLKVDNVRFVRPDAAMVHTLVRTWEGTEKAPDYPELLATSLLVKNGDKWEIVSFLNLDIEYDELLRKPEPTDEEITAFAKERFPGWYR